MKNFISLLLIPILMFGLCACSDTKNSEEISKMYIEPAQLTEEEKNIAELLDLNKNQIIFDFVIDDTVKCIQVNTYRLVNGKWELQSGGGGQTFTDTNGRIALDFEKLAEGIGVAIQSEHTSGSTSYERELDEELSDIGGYTTAILSDRTEIIYENEVPLAVQVITSKNKIVSYQVDYFNHPEEYEKLGYEGVFAVTVRFSQNPVS